MFAYHHHTTFAELITASGTDTHVCSLLQWRCARPRLRAGRRASALIVLDRPTLSGRLRGWAGQERGSRKIVWVQLECSGGFTPPSGCSGGLRPPNVDRRSTLQSGEVNSPLHSNCTRGWRIHWSSCMRPEPRTASRRSGASITASALSSDTSPLGWRLGFSHAFPLVRFVFGASRPRLASSNLTMEPWGSTTHLYDPSRDGP